MNLPSTSERSLCCCARERAHDKFNNLLVYGLRVAVVLCSPLHLCCLAVVLAKVGSWCRCGNQEIYRRLRLVPRVMRNVADISMDTSMLGHKMSFPVYISAAAKGGLAHADAEEALCRAAYAKKTIQMCPHMATKTLEQVWRLAQRMRLVQPRCYMV